MELHEKAKTWGASTWEEFLSSTVDHRLQETLSEVKSIEELEDGYRANYQEIVSSAGSNPNLRRHVRSLLKRLTIRERLVIYSIFWQGKRQAEIARDLNIRRSSVRNYRDRALKKLGVLFVQNMMSPKGLAKTSEKIVHGF